MNDRMSSNSGTTRWSTLAGFALLALLVGLQFEYVRSDLAAWFETELSDGPVSDEVRKQWVRPWVTIFNVTALKAWGIGEQDVVYAARLLVRGALVAIAIWFWVGRSPRLAALAFALFVAASLLDRHVIGPHVDPVIRTSVNALTIPFQLMEREPHPLFRIPGQLLLSLISGTIWGTIAAFVMLAPLCVLDARFRAPKAWLVMILVPILISSSNARTVFDLVKAHVVALPHIFFDNKFTSAINWATWAWCIGYAASGRASSGASVIDPEARRGRRMILLIILAIFVVAVAIWAWAVWNLWHERSLLPPPKPIP